MIHSIFTNPKEIQRLETELLPPWIVKCRWFAGKARVPQTFQIVRRTLLGESCILAIEINYLEGNPETYIVPLAVGKPAETQAIVAELEDGTQLYDACYARDFRDSLFASFRQEEEEFQSETSSELSQLFPNKNSRPESSVLEGEQSNTSIIYANRMFVKLYRRLEMGINPDAELTQLLSPSNISAPFVGMLHWQGASFALATTLVENNGTAWDLALLAFTQKEEDWFEQIELLGKRTGEMHLALAAEPEPFTAADTQTVLDGIVDLAKNVQTLLHRQLDSMEVEGRRLAEAFLQKPITIDSFAKSLIAVKTRTHSDYHLGQVLDSKNDFVIIDFEGEPSRSLAERRAKHPAYRDVAGMLRSIHYAAHAGRKNSNSISLAEAEQWVAQSQHHFLAAWRSVIAGSPIETDSDAELLRLFLLEKALYEAQYELNNRPDWLEIPLRGLESILSS